MGAGCPCRDGGWYAPALVSEPPAHLQTIAEVAAAFTGFAGLVSVLGRSRLDPKVRLWRVQVMIVTSLASLFGALAPSILQQVVSEDAALWRVSACVLLALFATQLGFVFRGMPSEQASGVLRLVKTPAGAVLTICSLGFQLVLLAVVLGGLSRMAMAVYSVAVLFLLLASSYHFLVLVRGAQPDAGSERPGGSQEP